MGIKRIRRRNIRDHLLRYPVASTSTWKSSGSDGSNVSSNSKDGTTLTHSSSTSLASFRKEDPNANKNSKNSNQKNALWTVHEKPLLPTKKKAAVITPKLRVRFQKQVRVKPTLHHQNYTHQEKTACWYEKADYTTMHEHVYMIVEFHKLLQQQTTTTSTTTSASTRPAKSSLPSISLKTSPALEEEAAVLCTRGLEGYLTTRESNSKTTNGAHAHRNRHRAIHAVLTEQEQQQEQQEAMALASSSILLAYGYDTEKIRAVYQSHTHPAEQNAQALGRTDAITAGITTPGAPAPAGTVRRPTHHHTKKRTATDDSKDTVWRHCGTLSAAHAAIEELDQQIEHLEHEHSTNTKHGSSLMEALFPDVALEAASLQLLGRSPPATATVATTMPTSTGTTPAVATTISSATDALLTSSLSSWSVHIKGGRTTTETTSQCPSTTSSTSTSTDLFQVQNPATHAVSPWNFTTR